MHNARFVLIVGAALLLLGSTDALAKNMHGKFGVGYQQTMLGAHGFSFTYWTTPSFGLNFLAGSEFALDEDNDNTTTLYASLGLRYVVYATKLANLDIGLRGILGWLSEPSATQFGVELPIEVELFLSNSFSINLATGLTFTMVPDNGPLFEAAGLGGVSEPNSKGVGIGAGGLFGHAGFTFYF